MSALETSLSLLDQPPGAVPVREIPPELFRQLIDQSSDAIFVVDPPTGRILDVNERACLSLGYPRAELLALTMLQIEVAYDGFSWPEQVERVCAGEVELIETGQKRKTGEVFPVEITLKAVEAGNQSFIVAAARDITEKKQLEAKFLRAQRLESIGRLAGGIAHDLNNVLSPVLMSAEILRQKMPDEEGRQIVDIIESTARRGTDMIRQILTFARGVKGERMAVHLRELVSELMKMGRETFPRTIQLRANVRPELWPVLGDATQLHQVLMNLCVNACDAMPEGGMLEVSGENCWVDEAQVRAQPGARPGPYVCLSVKDTGTGIPPEVLERMFEPFFTTKEFGKGTGLGLATALGIVQGHGGFVTVESQLGKGSRFQVYLPAQAATAGSGPEPDATSALCGNHELILVVDDEASIRRVIQMVLTQHGFDVITACDGAEALLVYKQRRQAVQAVLIDLAMPRLGGTAAIRKLRKLNPWLPILAMSGFLGTEELATQVPGKRVSLLVKPCSAADLLRAVGGLLGRAPAVA